MDLTSVGQHDQHESLLKLLHCTTTGSKNWELCVSSREVFIFVCGKDSFQRPRTYFGQSGIGLQVEGCLHLGGRTIRPFLKLAGSCGQSSQVHSFTRMMLIFTRNLASARALGIVHAVRRRSNKQQSEGIRSGQPEEAIPCQSRASVPKSCAKIPINIIEAYRVYIYICMLVQGGRAMQSLRFSH